MSSFLDYTTKYPLLLLLLRKERRWRIERARRRLAWACALTWLLTSSLMPTLSSITMQSPQPIFDTFGWLVPIMHGDRPLSLYHMDYESALRTQSILTQVMVQGRTFH